MLKYSEPTQPSKDSLIRLVNIRDELIQEEEDEMDNESDIEHDVVTIVGNYANTEQQLILDTGAQMSVMSIEKYYELKALEKDRINIDNQRYRIHELPITNINLVGITGKMNKTARKQIMVNILLNNQYVSFEFIVCAGIPVSILVGCKDLYKYKASIDLETGMVKLNNKGELIEIKILIKKIRDRALKSIHYITNHVLPTMYVYQSNKYIKEVGNQQLWKKKMNDIDEFHSTAQLINESQKQQLKEIYLAHQTVFSVQPGKIKNYRCRLPIKGPVVITRKSYPIPYKFREQVQQEINRMLAEDIIEESMSEYTSPLVVIPKKDQTIRLCLDARQINQFLVADKNSPENIEEILKQFYEAKFFSSWDAVSSYWQIELHPDSRQYVSFIVNGKNYQFKRLPFGLVNSVAIFIRCMDHVLGPELLQFTTVYVDDLVIASNNWQQHCSRVKAVLERLSECGVTLNLEKSTFIAKQIKFLGFIISDQGINADPDKIAAIQNFPKPRKLVQLQSFLGLCNYYRKFQLNYSDLTQRFQHLLRKNQKWNWTEKDDETFRLVKEKFLQCIMLHHPDFSKPFYINCDASGVSVGSVLYQENQLNENQVIAFASRTLTKSELNYTITEKETLSVVFAVNKFRTYILNHEVIIRTDHQAITFFKNCKLTHGRLTRWKLLLQEYQIKWEYVAGRKNMVADVLSRINSQEEVIDKIKYKILTVFRTKEELAHTIDKLKMAQIRDRQIQQLINRIQSSNNSADNHYSYHDGILFKNKNDKHIDWKILVPTAMNKEVILDYHERYGHLGQKKVIAALQEHFYIKKIEKNVARTIESCDLCQKVKVGNVRYEGRWITNYAKRALDQVFVDICGPFPSSSRHRFRYLLIILDAYSRYTKLYNITRANTVTIIQIFKEKYIKEIGRPKSVVTDHGTQFRGERWKRSMLEMGIKTYKTSKYHPNSNMAERMLREIGRILRAYSHENQQKWSEYTLKAEEFVNLACHDSTGVTPYEALFKKRPPRVIEEIVNFEWFEKPQQDLVHKIETRVKAKAEERARRQNKGRYIQIQYQIGDKVLIKNRQLPSSENRLMKKLFLCYVGPFVVTETFTNNTVRLTFMDGRKKGIYNINQLKPYKEEKLDSDGS